MSDDEPFDHCNLCDHSYQLRQPCVGTAVACKECCTDMHGEYIYVPQYIIEELVLT